MTDFEKAFSKMTSDPQKKVNECGIRLNESERFDASNWQGTNILGFALMEVRDMLKQKSE